MHKSKLQQFGVRTHELLSKQTQRKIKGGFFASCTVTCSDGTTLTCTGTTCTSSSGGCSASTGDEAEAKSCSNKLNLF